MAEYTYESLQRHGWAINTQTGVVRPGYASVSLCLYIDGHRHVCVPGSGVTYNEALADAIAAANAWIRHQRPTHPALRAMEGHQAAR